MPEISRFYGIVIMMFADDHNPPHFHVRYGGNRAIIMIADGELSGRMSRKELKRIYEWLDLHKQELLDNWERLKNDEEPLPIEPLK